MPREQEQFTLRLPDGQIFQAGPERRATIIDKAIMGFEDGTPVHTATLADVVHGRVPDVYTNVNIIRDRKILSSLGWEIGVKNGIVSLSKVEDEQEQRPSGIGYFEVPRMDMSPKLVVANMIAERGFPITTSEGVQNSAGNELPNWVRVTFGSQEARNLFTIISSTVPYRAFAEAFLGNHESMATLLMFCVEWDEQTRKKVAAFGLKNGASRLGGYIHAFAEAAERIEQGEEVKEVHMRIDQLDHDVTLEVPESFITSGENRYKNLYQFEKLKGQLETQARELNQGQDSLTPAQVPDLFKGLVEGSIKNVLPYYDELAKFGDGVNKLTAEMTQEIEAKNKTTKQQHDIKES